MTDSPWNILGPFTVDTEDASLVLVTRDGITIAPIFQFDPEIREEFDQVLTHLHGADKWTIAGWFFGKFPSLDERTPLEALRDGDVKRVIALADNTTYNWNQ